MRLSLAGVASPHGSAHTLDEIHKAKYICTRRWCSLVANIPRNRPGIVFPCDNSLADRPEISQIFLSAGDFLCPGVVKDYQPAEHQEDLVEDFGRAQQDDSRGWFMVIS